MNALLRRRGMMAMAATSEEHPYIEHYTYYPETGAYTDDTSSYFRAFKGKFLNHGTGLYWFRVENTLSSPYRVLYGTYSSLNNTQCFSRANNNKITDDVYVAYYEAGNRIDVYFVPYLALENL